MVNSSGFSVPIDAVAIGWKTFVSINGRMKFTRQRVAFANASCPRRRRCTHKRVTDTQRAAAGLCSA